MLAATGLNRGIGEIIDDEDRGARGGQVSARAGRRCDGGDDVQRERALRPGLSRLEHAARAADRQGRRRQRRQQGRHHALARRLRAMATGSAACSSTRRAPRFCSSTAPIRRSDVRVRRRTVPVTMRTSGVPIAVCDTAVRCAVAESRCRLNAIALVDTGPDRRRSLMSPAVDALAPRSRPPAPGREPHPATRRGAAADASPRAGHDVLRRPATTSASRPRQSALDNAGRRAGVQLGGDVGEGRRQAADPRDAASRRAPAGQRDLRPRRDLARDRAGSRRRGAPESRPPGRSPSPQSRRVRQRHSRPARRGDRSEGDAAARRAGARVRHQRRCAVDAAGAARSLSHRGHQDRAPRRRRSDDSGRRSSATPRSRATRTSPPGCGRRDRLGEEFPLGSRGGIAARHYFPVDGEYVFKIRLDRTDDRASSAACNVPQRDRDSRRRRAGRAVDGRRHAGVRRRSGGRDWQLRRCEQSAYDRR